MLIEQFKIDGQPRVNVISFPAVIWFDSYRQLLIPIYFYPLSNNFKLISNLQRGELKGYFISSAPFQICST